MTSCHRINLAILLLTACAANDPSSAGPDAPSRFGPPMIATPDQQSAIGSLHESLSELATPDLQGESAASATFQFVASAELLLPVQPPPTARRAGSAMRAAAPRSMSTLAVADQGNPDDCAVVTASTITWNHCTESFGDYTATIDGMISWSPGHIELDVEEHATASGQSASFEFKVTGSMTVSASAIQGDVTFAFSESSGGSTASEMLHVLIDVQLTQDCVSSGTLTVTETSAGTGTQPQGIQVVWTGCDEFRVRSST